MQTDDKLYCQSKSLEETLAYLTRLVLCNLFPFVIDPNKMNLGGMAP